MQLRPLQRVSPPPAGQVPNEIDCLVGGITEILGEAHMTPGLLTIDQAAKRAGVSRASVNRWRAAGLLTGSLYLGHVPLIDESELARVLEEHRGGGRITKGLLAPK